MNVVVSGQAGFALLFEGKQLHSMHRARPGELIPRHPSALRLLLNGVRDLEIFENVDPRRAETELELASARADALHLALILLDSSLPDDLRGDAAAELEELLADERVASYVEGVLWSHPLPADGDLPGAKRLAEPIAPHAFRLLGEFEKDQSNIALAWAAWQEIPAATFRTEEEAGQARAKAVRRGLFRWLVSQIASAPTHDKLLLELLANPVAQSLPNHRSVCRAWLAPLGKARAARDLGWSNDRIIAEVAEPEAERLRSGRRLSAQEALDLVDRQKVAIVEAMRHRDLPTVRKYVQDLVERHLQGPNGSAFASKSLCHLAMQAKDLGDHETQLELTTLATQLEPGDGWAWAQQGDSLRSNERYQEALVAYDRALALGNSDIGRTGKAEVLKALNRLPEALDAYDAVINEFTHDAVARNGRAEVLKALNRLPDALQAYDDVIREFPRNVVARNGRAEVLKALGRLPEALSAYSAVTQEFPGNAVARTGRAELLKALDQLSEALAAYDEIARDFPGDLVARNGRAGVLTEMARWDEALLLLPSHRPSLLEDWIGYHMRGMIFLRTGRLYEARRVFEEGIKASLPPGESGYFSSGLALCHLKAREYAEAARILEEAVVPLQEDRTNVLRFHAYGAQGERRKAEEVEQKLLGRTSPVLLVELRDELGRQFLERGTPLYSEDWIIEREIELLAA